MARGFQFLIRPLLALALGAPSQVFATTAAPTKFLPSSMMGSLFVINSSMTVEQALRAYLPAEDFTNVKAYFEKQHVDLSSLTMNQSLVYDGKIHYGKKVAEIQDNLSIKVDGLYLKYDRAQTPGANYLRFLKQFSNSASNKSNFAASLIPAIIPTAKADDNSAIETAVDTASLARTTAAPGAAATAAATEEAKASYLSALKTKYSDAFKDLISSGKKFVTVSKDAVVDGSTALRSGVTNTARAGAAAVSENAANIAKGASTLAKGAAEGAARVATGAAATTARVAVGTYEVGAAVLSTTAGAAAAGVLIAGAVAYGGNWGYHWWYNGTFECAPKDGKGDSAYIFNYKSEKSTLGWEHFDQRIFTPQEMGAIFNEKDAVPECSPQRAADFSSIVSKYADAGVQTLRDINFDREAPRRANHNPVSQ